MAEVFSAEVYSSRIVDEISDPIRDAVLTAVLTSNSIPDYILAALLNGFDKAMDKYLDYGRDHYIRALPTAIITGTGVDRDKADAIVEEDIGEPLTVDVSILSYPAAHYFGYIYLQETTDYDYFSNSLTKQVMDEDDGMPYTETWYVSSIVWDAYGATPTSGMETGEILITYYRKINNGEDPEYNDYFSQTIGGPEKEDYLQVQYHLDTQTADHALFWVYKMSDGEHDDIIPEKLPIESEFYPIVPIRLSEKFIDKDKESEEYKTSKNLLEKVMVDLDDVIDAISNTEDDEGNKSPNEDLEYLHDGFILFAADLYTTVDATIEYLYRYFEKLETTALVTKEEFEIAFELMDQGVKPPTNRFTVTESEFNVDIEYNWITIETVSGQLDSGETYEREIEKVGDGVYSVRTCTGGEIVDGAYVVYPVCNTIQVGTNIYHLKKQNEDNTYTHIQISGLLHRITVTAFGYTRVLGKALKPKYLNPEPGEEGTGGFYIPCDYNTMDEMSMKNKSTAAQDMLTLVLYAADVTKLKWYQTGFFAALLKFVLNLVAVIFAIPTGGASVGFTAVLWAFIVAFAAPVVLGYIMELLVKEFGKDMAILIAVVAIAFKMYKSGFFAGLLKLPFADALLEATKAIINLVGTYTSIEGYAEELEYSLWLDNEEERQEKLDNEQDMLGDESNPFDWMNVVQATSLLNPNETPEDFFTRTIHTGNPGVLSLDAIESYADEALRLPEVDLTNDSMSDQYAFEH